MIFFFFFLPKISIFLCWIQVNFPPLSFCFHLVPPPPFHFSPTIELRFVFVGGQKRWLCFGMVKTQTLAFCSLLFAVIACSCFGVLLVELAHVLQHFKKHERMWVGVAVSSLIISAFAFLSTFLICLNSLYTSERNTKIAPAPTSDAEEPPAVV